MPGERCACKHHRVVAEFVAVRPRVRHTPEQPLLRLTDACELGVLIEGALKCGLLGSVFTRLKQHIVHALRVQCVTNICSAQTCKSTDQLGDPLVFFGRLANIRRGAKRIESSAGSGQNLCAEAALAGGRDHQSACIGVLLASDVHDCWHLSASRRHRHVAGHQAHRKRACGYECADDGDCYDRRRRTLGGVGTNRHETKNCEPVQHEPRARPDRNLRAPVRGEREVGRGDCGNDAHGAKQRVQHGQCDTTRVQTEECEQREWQQQYANEQRRGCATHADLVENICPTLEPELWEPEEHVPGVAWRVGQGDARIHEEVERPSTEHGRDDLRRKQHERSDRDRDDSECSAEAAEDADHQEDKCCGNEDRGAGERNCREQRSGSSPTP